MSCPSLFRYRAPAPAATYTLSLHDALPISLRPGAIGEQGPAARQQDGSAVGCAEGRQERNHRRGRALDRKSTRLNSSHGYISYAVFCLKKKKAAKQAKAAQTPTAPAA